MKLSTIILSGIVALAVSAGTLFLVTPEAAPVVVGSGGAISNVNYYSAAGVTTYYGSAGLKSATSTPCAIQSPAATSTLMAAGLRLDNASSTATIWVIAKGTTPFATTTAFGTEYTVGASGQAFIQASTSPTAGAATVLAPNTYIVFGARAAITAGDTGGLGFVPVGQCSAEFLTTQV